MEFHGLKRHFSAWQLSLRWIPGPLQRTCFFFKSSHNNNSKNKKTTTNPCNKSPWSPQVSSLTVYTSTSRVPEWHRALLVPFLSSVTLPDSPLPCGHRGNQLWPLHCRPFPITKPGLYGNIEDKQPVLTVSRCRGRCWEQFLKRMKTEVLDADTNS